MSEIFRRRSRVTIGKIGEVGRAWNGGGEGGLRMSFEVMKSSTKEPNTCKVELTNLGPDSRRAITLGQHLILEAGYEGAIEILARGDITHVESVHDGTEWFTRVEVEDGRRALRKKVHVSFAPGASPGQVVDKILGDMKKEGAAVGFLSRLAKQGADFAAGFSASGDAGDVLEKALRGSDLEVSVQDNAIQIVEKDGATNDPIVSLSSDSGLVGSVAVTRDSKDGKKSGVKVTAKLQPKIAPGRRFQTRGQVDGVFIARKVTHRGDTHGDPWDTEIEAA